ncbi:uncharacterized protein ALTATR162_LOCUS713 [Alternaria atra]|uniref:Uncharacterized protein n=1 Tax=Alternaria atra TaxID=119953 RepID=A0A8J2HUJ2_9PLEO|nr:uncharacterized protein ALTATR162_LOCUS713 [Alternaria atra]CAG5140454.1 unnamed protein product [Alternaria atra]
MPPDSASLIEECTNGTTKAGLYLSRLGLEQEFKNPNRPGRPNFKSVPELQGFWVATNLEIKAIAALYQSRKAIREALRNRLICLDEISRDCLNSYGQQIWNNGEEADFVLSVDTTTAPSKIKGHAQVAEDKYLRHLIYEHPSDERKIRLQVSAWIIQRACRKAEDDRREGKTAQKAYGKVSNKSSSFVQAASVNRSKRTRSTSLSYDSFDELNDNYSADPAVRSKHTGHSNTVDQSQRRSSRKDHDIQHTPAKRRKKQIVAVVIPPRRSQDIEATGTASRKRKRGELLYNRNTAIRSIRGKKEDIPRETPQTPNSRRTTRGHTRTKAGGERPSKFGAEGNRERLVRQLDDDRDALGEELHDLLLPHNPGCHYLADIKRTTGLIDSIALNDAEGIQKALGNAHEKHKIALDRWLGCVKTLVEFREITSLEGDEVVIEARFPSLTLGIKKKARFLRNKKRREILSWFKKDKFKIFDFSQEVASILLKMTSWGGLDMDPEELLDDMIPFTTRLLEWFRAVPSNSTTGVIKP